MDQLDDLNHQLEQAKIQFWNYEFAFIKLTDEIKDSKDGGSREVQEELLGLMRARKNTHATIMALEQSIMEYKQIVRPIEKSRVVSMSEWKINRAKVAKTK